MQPSLQLRCFCIGCFGAQSPAADYSGSSSRAGQERGPGLHLVLLPLCSRPLTACQLPQVRQLESDTCGAQGLGKLGTALGKRPPDVLSGWLGI